MSQTLVPVTLVAGVGKNVQLPNPSTVKAVILSNKSSYDLIIQGLDSVGPRWHASGTENIYPSDGHNQGLMSIQPVNTANLANPPTSVALITVYLENDTLPKGSWPVSIPTQTVNTTSNQTTNLVNDGNPLATQIIESTPAGAASSTISILNDGTVTIKGDVAGVLSTLLQLIPGGEAILGNAGNTTEVLGILKVDGASTLTGVVTAPAGIVGNASTSTTAATATAANFLNSGVNLQTGLGRVAALDVLDASTLGTTYFKGLPSSGNGAAILQAIGTGSATIISGAQNSIVCSGNNGLMFSTAKFGRTGSGDLIDASGTGVFIKGTGGAFVFQSTNGTTTWSRTQESVFTGSTSGTFNHNCGGTPNVIQPCCNVVSSSETVGYGSPTSTQVTITVGAAIAFSCYCARF